MQSAEGQTDPLRDEARVQSRVAQVAPYEFLDALSMLIVAAR